jgi:hypothetical protein
MYRVLNFALQAAMSSAELLVITQSSVNMNNKDNMDFDLQIKDS